MDQMDPQAEHQTPPPPPNTRLPSPLPAIRTLSPPPPPNAPPPTPHYTEDNTACPVIPDLPPSPYSRDDPARHVHLCPRRRYSPFPSHRFCQLPRPQGRSHSSPPPRRRSLPGARQPPRRGRHDQVAPALHKYNRARSCGQPPLGPPKGSGTALVSAMLLAMMSTRASTIALALTKVSTPTMGCIVSFVLLFVVTRVN